MLPGFVRGAPGRRCQGGLVGVLCAALMGGCSQRSADELRVEPPGGWKPTSASRFAVPGTPRAAWVGPEGASLVIYRTLPAPEGTAQKLAEELANRLAVLPQLTLVAQRTETLGGAEAARVEAIAPGTGAALAPSGTGQPLAPKGAQLVPTHRVTIGFPLPRETLWLTWHYPERAHAAIEPQIEATLRSLRLQTSKAP